MAKRELMEILLDSITPGLWPEHLPYAVFSKKKMKIYVSELLPIKAIDGGWWVPVCPGSSGMLNLDETPSKWSKTIIHRADFVRLHDEMSQSELLKKRARLRSEYITAIVGDDVKAGDAVCFSDNGNLKKLNKTPVGEIKYVWGQGAVKALQEASDESDEMAPAKTCDDLYKGIKLTADCPVSAKLVPGVDWEEEAFAIAWRDYFSKIPSEIMVEMRAGKYDLNKEIIRDAWHKAVSEMAEEIKKKLQVSRR